MNLTPFGIWTIWFLVIASLGSLIDAGLQSTLGLSVWYGSAFIVFVLVIAVAIADLKTIVFEQRNSSKAERERND